MWYVYVLRSLKNNRLYTGSTSDIERRLAEHAAGKTKYTSYTGPYELVYQETYQTRLEARQRELFLKTGKGREFLMGRLQQAGWSSRLRRRVGSSSPPPPTTGLELI